MHVDNPLQCAPHNPGYTRIVNLEEPNQVLLKNVIFWPDEIVISEYVCKTQGNSIICPPEDQVLDMRYWGFDAKVTNKTSHGAGQGIENGYKMDYSMRRNTCTGWDEENPEINDCDIVVEWMFGEGATFPCNIGPWRTEYIRISD
jgi:hypothetical protein